ncbi:MAG: wax ester/triacylglycerol synthase family O-acyltransferase [Nocardioides sp.]
MEGVDAGFLYLETPSVHMHTLKIAILEADPLLTFDTFVAGMMARLEKLPPLRRQVIPVPFGLNHPIWITRPTVVPSRHIHQHRAPGAGTMRDLEVLIGRISSTPLDRRFPLWELHLVEGLEGGRVAVVGKMHHALADGAAANALLGNVTNVRSAELPIAPPGEYLTTERTPTRRQLIGWALHDATRQFRDLPGLLWRTVQGLRAASKYRRHEETGVPLPVLHAPRTSINGSLTPRRTFATTSLPLAEFKRIRKQHEGVTLNDLVLAVVSGSLRRWMAAHDEHPSASLTAGVPVGVDDRDAAPRLGGNRVSNMFTTLATDIDDPAERLRVISRTTAHAKQLQERLGRHTLIDWTQFAPPLPFSGAVSAYSKMRGASWHPAAFTAVVSNVPGPREPVRIGSARLADLFSVGPLADGIGLNVTVWSYIDRMNFSLLACPDLLPDVEALAAYFPAALAELDMEADAAAADATPSTESTPTDGQATA